MSYLNGSVEVFPKVEQFAGGPSFGVRVRWLRRECLASGLAAEKDREYQKWKPPSKTLSMPPARRLDSAPHSPGVGPFRLAMGEAEPGGSDPSVFVA